MSEPRSLFISPALDAAKDVGVERIPKSKAELVEILNKPKKQRIIDEKTYLSYKLQNISRWKNVNDTFEIVLGRGDFIEPYFVTHRYTMFYDEIFNSYGRDKATQLETMVDIGFKMKVLPDTFIVHLSHESLKNFPNWLTGFQFDKRYNLKDSTFETFFRAFKGIYANAYYPPWLKNIDKELCLLSNSTRLNDFQRMNAAMKGRVTLLKQSLGFMLSVLGALLIFMVVASKKDKERRGNDIKKT